MDLPIISYSQVGPIAFGMPPSTVHSILGPDFKSFKKTPASEMPTDAYDPLGIHIYYKKPGLCDAVELAAPSVPTFQERKLIGIPFEELRRFFESIDATVEVDDTGLTSHKFGIGLYAPDHMQSPRSPVEAVIAFERGYYG